MEGFVLLDTGAWSLVPPLLALALALITKEVYSSLLIGIVSGLLIYQFSLAGVGLEQTIDGLCLLPNIFIEQISANAGLILFLALLGALTMLITKAGGSIAYAKWAVKRIKNPRVASIATALLGVIIFVDDYFNCLTVGSVMRPVTDRFKICREKLAWIIDSTAAPICIIVPVSSWAVAVGGYLGEDGFNTFVASIPYNFYALLTIVFVFAMCACGRDFGPMKRAQQAFETRFKQPRKGIKHAAEESLAPSSSAVREDIDETLEDNVRLQDMAGEALDAYDQLHIARNGRVYDLIVPILVLIIFSILGMMYAGGFFQGIDFATAMGTSWGTIALVIPIVIGVFTPESPLYLLTIGATLAGAVYGDHISPISDTTILSSAGASCNHLAHVTTQLPYASLVAGICLVGYLVAGLSLSPWPSLVGGLALILLFIGGLVVKNRPSE